MTELKPCPFCGRGPELETLNGEAFIYCNTQSCGICGVGLSLTEWNRRHGHKQLEARIAELEFKNERSRIYEDEVAKDILAYEARIAELENAIKSWLPLAVPDPVIAEFLARTPTQTFQELQRDADRYRFLRDEDNWGEDSGDDWGTLGEAHAEEFDEIVDERMANS